MQFVETRHRLRELTASQRRLPDLLIIGAQRSGTSSLHRYLAMHPAVQRPLRKEAGYLAFRHNRGEVWYRANFPLELPVRRRQRPAFTYDATPDYLFHPHSAAWASNLLPDTRVAVLLRNPIDRALSHYAHTVRHGHEQLPLLAALQAEPDRLGEEWSRLLVDPDFPAPSVRRYSYAARGRYAEQLKRWLAWLPPERILVLDSALVFQHPVEAFSTLLDFVNLPQWRPPAFKNYSYSGRRRPPRTEEVRHEQQAREYLDDVFQSPNASLADLGLSSLSWL